jgi:hypothetical protein
MVNKNYYVVHYGKIKPAHFLFNGETQFHLSEYVKAQHNILVCSK